MWLVLPVKDYRFACESFEDSADLSHNIVSLRIESVTGGETQQVNDFMCEFFGHGRC